MLSSSQVFEVATIIRITTVKSTQGRRPYITFFGESFFRKQHTYLCPTCSRCPCTNATYVHVSPTKRLYDMNEHEQQTNTFRKAVRLPLPPPGHLFFNSCSIVYRIAHRTCARPFVSSSLLSKSITIQSWSPHTSLDPRSTARAGTYC